MVLLGSLGSLGSPEGSPQCNSGHMTADIMESSVLAPLVSF